MSWIDTFLATGLWFVFGACIGSFLNVVVYRSERGESWVGGRSHCDECDKPVAWFDNIPLLSYVMLRGRCRHCKKNISMAHPVVEALFGFLFMWWWILGSFAFRLTEEPFIYIQPLFWLIVGGILIFIFVEDLLTMYIPLWSVYSLTALAFLYRLALVNWDIMRPNDFWMTISAALFATGFFLAINVFTKGRGMGLGDVYLALPLALLVGSGRTVIWVFLSFLIGSAVGLVLLSMKKAQFGRKLPFGPFMITAAIVALLWGDQLWSWYLGLL